LPRNYKEEQPLLQQIIGKPWPNNSYKITYCKINKKKRRSNKTKRISFKPVEKTRKSVN
jgi:disulfide oxidoreductase YuzD